MRTGGERSPTRQERRLGRLRFWLLKLRRSGGDEVPAASATAGMDLGHHPRKGTAMEHALGARELEDPIDSDCTVGLVLTGGTIGAREDDSVLSVGQDPTSAEADLTSEQWPGPTRPSVAVRYPIRQLSENLEPQDWLSIADSICELAEHERIIGALVLHGTDTMAYTASALSFFLTDIDFPVVLTGSNIPSGQRGSDAARNVHTALIAMRSLNPGVYVCFAGGSELPGYVYLGTHVRKLRAAGAAFASINRDPVGVVKGEEFEPIEPYNPMQHSEGFLLKVDEHVFAIRLYPGLDLDVTFDAIDQGHVRGVVIELYTSATGPADTDDPRFSVSRFIRRCTQRDIVVVTTIAEAPPTNGKVYETTVAINDAGGAFLHDMLPETATVKLMWALAQSQDPQVVRDLMLRPIAGELRAPSQAA